MELLEVGIQITLILIGSFIALLSSLLLGWHQLNRTRKNVAYALLFEITEMEHSLHSLAGLSREPSENRLFLPQTIYPEKGLYYTFNKDISQFGGELSNGLYKFYKYLESAEDERKLVIHLDSRNKNRDLSSIRMEPVGIAATIHMKKSIISAANMIPQLKTMLEHECNSSLRLLNCSIFSSRD